MGGHPGSGARAGRSLSPRQPPGECGGSSSTQRRWLHVSSRCPPPAPLACEDPLCIPIPPPCRKTGRPRKAPSQRSHADPLFHPRPRGHRMLAAASRRARCRGTLARCVATPMTWASAVPSRVPGGGEVGAIPGRCGCLCPRGASGAVLANGGRPGRGAARGPPRPPRHGPPSHIDPHTWHRMYFTFMNTPL